MKNTKLITMLCLGALIACSPSKKGLEPTSEQGSPRERLIENLRAIPQKGIMFGHHDDTVYGIGWEFDEGGSDVRKVCGDYPAVISFDLGEIELGGDKSLDKVPFEKIRKEIINQYNRGGLVSLSWHPRNPKTGGDAWDVSDHAVVKSILPEGENYEKFQSWLGKVNDFILSLKTSDGTKIPVLFRPWHEHTGSWFWWGQNLCIRSLMYWYGETPVKKSLTSLALIPDKPLPRISRSSLKIRKHCSPPISTYINNIIHNQINHVISSCRDGACPVSHHLIISFKAKTSWNNFKKK